MLVYVLKQNGQPFMPTERFGKVRRLLKEGKAKVVRREPFTIRLLYEPETDVVQECYCGVDTGSRHIGVAVVGNDRVLYQSQTELRSDIKKKMDARRQLRKFRRSRKTRYRKHRFLNRHGSIREDRLPPSVKHKVQAHIDEIEFCKKILPVSDLILEVSQFNTALMKSPCLMNEKIKHWGYQKGFNYGYASRRSAILHRDNYTCQCCGKKNCRLEVHHIKFRRDGGTDDEENLITLCEECHKGVHAGIVVLNKKPKKSKNLKHATHMSIIRSRLLKVYPDAVETFGFVTSENRNHLNLPKDHYIDACVIASGGLEFKPSDIIYYKCRVSKGDYQVTRGVRGEQKIPTGKICGFRRYDKVEYFGKEYFIKGRMSSGFALLMDIFGKKADFSSMPNGLKTPKLSNCKRTSARRSYLCIRKIERSRVI
jgi:5-methylcytosine-specific restriction endonuclease McrA